MVHRAIHFATFGNQAVVHCGALGDVVRRHARITGVDPPLFVMQVNGHGGGKQIHIGLPEALNGAYILPVAIKAVRAQHLFVRQHGGDDILAKVVAALLVRLVGDQVLTQFFPGKDIHTHGSLVGLGVLGLFFELNDVVVRVGVHNAEAAGIGPGHFAHGDGGVRLVTDVEIQHVIVVHLIDVVTAEDEHIIRIILGDERHVLINGVGRAAIPFAALSLLIGGENEHAAVGQVQVPGSAAADISVQFQGLVLGQHTHYINTAVGAVGQRKVNDAVLASVGHGGFGNVLGQDAALSAGQQHGHTGFLPQHGVHAPSY